LLFKTSNSIKEICEKVRIALLAKIDKSTIPLLFDKTRLVLFYLNTTTLSICRLVSASTIIPHSQKAFTEKSKKIKG